MRLSEGRPLRTEDTTTVKLSFRCTLGKEKEEEKGRARGGVVKLRGGEMCEDDKKKKEKRDLADSRLL